MWASQLDVELFILEIPVKNTRPFSDTLVRRKFVLGLSGVLTNDCSVSEEQLQLRRVCVTIVLYPTDNHLWEGFTGFSPAVGY